jgi:hypothetical protein
MAKFQMREEIHTAKAIQVAMHSLSSAAWFINRAQPLGTPPGPIPIVEKAICQPNTMRNTMKRN